MQKNGDVSAITAREGDALRISKEILKLLFPDHSRLSVAVRSWQGDFLVDPGGPPQVTIHLTHPGSLRRMLLPPGELTLAEAYLRGDFDVDGDIEKVIDGVETIASLGWKNWLEVLRLARQLPASDPDELFSDGRQRAHLRGVTHSKKRDRDAIAYHYNVGNEFYRLFLGKWMTYSCAYFERPEMDLDAAQAAKLDLICRKLRLQPGERFLDIGCGWGGLVVYAAKHYGVRALGITLSEPQAEYARAWIQREGLEDRARVELLDYRDLESEGLFDKSASVGMFEHVGRANLPAYFQAAWRALRPGGLFLNHGIATQDRARPTWMQRKFLQQGEFTQRYVFPDGELVRVSEALDEAENAGFEVRDVESLREHYALTLRHWVANLEEMADRARALTSERTYRVWRLYMAASASGFARGRLNVFQALLLKDRNGFSGLPLTRADLYQAG